jgi:TPR repeat protein
LQIVGRAKSLYEKLYGNNDATKQELLDDGFDPAVVENAMRGDLEWILKLGKFYARTAKVDSHGLCLNGWRASFWLRRAADKHCVDAIMELGELHQAFKAGVDSCESGVPVAKSIYLEAAELGHVPGMLAVVRANREYASNEDAEDGFWLLQAAVAYLNGAGVEKDRAHAIELYAEGMGVADDTDPKVMACHVKFAEVGVEDAIRKLNSEG